MVEVSVTLYQLDFCADLTAAQAPVFNLGYMLEAALDDGARFLGLASRKALTRCELDCVNAETWPELADLDGYMGRLFDRAWAIADAALPGELHLGADELAAHYSAMSALSFCRKPVPAELIKSVREAEDQDWHSEFSKAVFGYGKLLEPTLTAQVLPFQHVPRVDAVKPRPEYRVKAA